MTEVKEDAAYRKAVNGIQGLGIIFFGGALSIAGFRLGLRRQFANAHEHEQVVVNPNQVGPSGATARDLAVRALVRGSAVAFVIAAFTGVALSYAVESRQPPISKEQNDREMNELIDAMGLQEEKKQ
jgi:hypothetical protein